MYSFFVLCQFIVNKKNHTNSEVRKKIPERSICLMWQSFCAFNINAFSKIVYNISTNIWVLATVVSVGIIVALSLKNVVDTTVRDEQNVL